MMIKTERLTLQSITPQLALRIIAREELNDDLWHPEYPFADEIDPLRGLAVSTSPHPVFTMYMVRRRADGLAIGGLGFIGAPDDCGRIEFGYGLIPSARGAGLATEAVRAALEFVREHGALVAIAYTHTANIASRRVLEKSGMIATHRVGDSVRFSRVLRTDHSGSPNRD
jgi:RimJ/RimL family protein N-acetyltransferase